MTGWTQGRLERFNGQTYLAFVPKNPSSQRHYTPNIDPCQALFNNIVVGAGIARPTYADDTVQS
ncbi:MAG: hypothetical protein FWD97_02775 [Defluviitaleaceae bacterium]|nr:hypothetical protein [Defluviitaleaceae bacterium]